LTVVLGLGNPGLEWARTRHNIGYLTVERLAARCGAPLRREADGLYEWSDATLGGVPAVLARPLTFMNLSGAAAAAIGARFGALPAEFLMVYDDVALPLGRLRLRSEGRSGGHKGAASVIEALGTGAVPRLRMGVGAAPAPEPGARSDLRGFVLEPFRAEEWPAAERMVDRAIEALSAAAGEGVEKAAARYNKRPSDEPGAAGGS